MTRNQVRRILITEEEYITDPWNYNHASTTDTGEFFHFGCLAGASPRDLQDYFETRRIPKHGEKRVCSECGGPIQARKEGSDVEAQMNRRYRYEKEMAR